MKKSNREHFGGKDDNIYLTMIVEHKGEECSGTVVLQKKTEGEFMRKGKSVLLAAKSTLLKKMRAICCDRCQESGCQMSRGECQHECIWCTSMSHQEYKRLPEYKRHILEFGTTEKPVRQTGVQFLIEEAKEASQ